VTQVVGAGFPPRVLEFSTVWLHAGPVADQVALELGLCCLGFRHSSVGPYLSLTAPEACDSLDDTIMCSLCKLVASGVARLLAAHRLWTFVTKAGLTLLYLPGTRIGLENRQATHTGNENVKAQCKIWGFHGGDYEEWCLLGRYAVKTSNLTFCEYFASTLFLVTGHLYFVASVLIESISNFHSILKVYQTNAFIFRMYQMSIHN
jgi:hypothetical protein